MLALLIAIGVFTALAVFVVRWAAGDLAATGTLSAKSLAASWLLYVLHADTVVSAAWGGVLIVDAPRVAALVAGGVLIAVGCVIFVAGTLTLVRHGDFEGVRTRRLVTVGPYRFSRHPQNLGWAIVLLGVAVAGRSLGALALVGLFAIFIDRYVRLEEYQLKQDFGAAYDDYRERTPAVMPSLGTRTARTAQRASTR
ncbi:MAG: methyltransferase family protein [Thermoleophilia bacterium]